VAKGGGSPTPKWPDWGGQATPCPNEGDWLATFFFSLDFVFDLRVFLKFVKIHGDNFKNLRQKKKKYKCMACDQFSIKLDGNS
jgi:hypothetical protein